MRTRPNPNGTLSLTRIVDAAQELVESEGIDELTMRKLARHLDVGVMSLYRHVRTKEDIFDALADRYLAEMDVVPDAELPWNERVEASFVAFYSLLLEHPALIRMIVGQRIDGVAAYAGAEQVLGALRGAGFDDDAAVATFETLACYTAGAAMRHGERASKVDRTAHLEELSEDEFPTVTQLAPTFILRRFDVAQGIRAILAGFAAQSTEADPG